VVRGDGQGNFRQCHGGERIVVARRCAGLAEYELGGEGLPAARDAQPYSTNGLSVGPSRGITDIKDFFTRHEGNPNAIGARVTLEMTDG